MAEHGSDYHHGQMDIHEQESSFQLFVGMTKWGSVFLAALLLFLTLWFCTKTGFLGALVSGVAVTAVGVLLLRDNSDAH